MGLAAAVDALLDNAALLGTQSLATRPLPLEPPTRLLLTAPTALVDLSPVHPRPPEAWYLHGTHSGSPWSTLRRLVDRNLRTWDDRPELSC